MAGEVSSPKPRQDAQLQALGFPPGMPTGTSGLELAFNQRLAGQPGGLAEAQPRLDAALAAGRAVVVDDPPDPAAADLEVIAVGQDRRILAGDVLLVVEAVGHPALDLPAAEPAGVHPDVERVLVVVAP